MSNSPVGQLKGSDLCSGEENMRLTMVSVMLMVLEVQISKELAGAGRMLAIWLQCQGFILVAPSPCHTHTLMIDRLPWKNNIQ